MSVYIVTRKSDGAEVYRYNADAPVEWSGMEFATHDHAVEADNGIPDAPVVAMIRTKLEYLRRFTQEERIAIRTAAKSSAALDDYMQLMELAEEVRSDDPDVASALAMLEGVGLIGAGRAQEILNGN